MLVDRRMVAFALVAPLLLCSLADPVGAQLETGEDAFPGPEEVHDRLAAFDEHPWIEVTQVGSSNEDRPISVAEVADPNASTPREQRTVTLLLTQQHGNEPAGTPAALRLLENVTSGGAVTDKLDEQILLVMPMVNPDGAAEHTRGNADGIDINRDHIGLETPEAQTIHRVLNDWDVDVAMDHHEYGGTGAGNPVPLRAYDYDLTTLFPVHGNVRAPTLDWAQSLMYDGIWPVVEDEGYTVNEYGEVTLNGEPVDEIAGGPDPGILRNHFGLHNIAGLLVESRIDAHPNPFHTPERRIQSHSVVMEATVDYVAEHAEKFSKAKQMSGQLALELPAHEYLEGEQTGELARAYELPEDENLADTMRMHAIETGASQDGQIVHDTWHPLQGHAAAIFHPDSSRAIVEGTPTELAGDEATEALEAAGEAGGNLTPMGSSLSVFALLAASLAVATTRDRVRRRDP